MATHSTVSDTVTVTPDGKTVVDIHKLFAKKHIRDAMKQMRAKTKIIRREKGKHSHAK